MQNLLGEAPGIVLVQSVFRRLLNTRIASPRFKNQACTIKNMELFYFENLLLGNGGWASWVEVNVHQHNFISLSFCVLARTLLVFISIQHWFSKTQKKHQENSSGVSNAFFKNRCLITHEK